MRFLVWWASNLLALWVAAKLVDGITYESVMSLLVAGFVLGAVNFVVRPLLVILTLPLVILTLGIALLFVNALMLLLTSALVPDFDVRDFFWAAVLGALVVSAVNMVLHALWNARTRRAGR